MKPADLIEILGYIQKCFPQLQRITTFARTHTIVRISDTDLKRIADHGLSRIHAGFETGSDNILAMVNKGCTKEMHIKGGLKVKKAGMELSECVLCGLGGKKFYQEHAHESADAMNKINPDIIRFLTLAAPAGAKLYTNHPPGAYIRSTDVDIAQEIKLFIENLHGVTTYIESNNILNLLQEVEGTLPHDRQKMIDVLNSFIALPPHMRTLFQVGKRMQIFSSLSDLNDPNRMNIARQTCDKYRITPDNADDIIGEMIQRYMN